MKYAKIIATAMAIASLFAPSYVSAATCSTNAVCPTSIEFLEKSENTVVLNDPSIDDVSINTDVKMLEIGDYIKYKLLLENASGDTFELSDLSFDDNKAIAYSFAFADNNNKIAPNETKEAILTIEYKNPIEDDDYLDNVYTADLNATLTLIKDNSAINPATSFDSPLMPIIAIATIIAVSYAFYRKYGRIRSATIMILLLGAFISIGVYAAESCVIEIKTKVTVPRYEGREINNVIMDKPIIDDEHSEYMEPVTGVNFLEPSSDTNGKGVYIFAPTKNDEIPIYYYRGAVNNNNLIFADYCWKIFRTTETEGLKIIYNGVPTNGRCVAEGDDTMVATGVKYNAAVNNLSYFGYSYASNGHTFSYMNNSRITNGMIFANDVSYVDGHYVLNDDQYVKDSDFATNRDSILKTHHYTCYVVNGTECTTVRYVYMTRSVNMFYVTLKNGEKIEDVVRDEVTNEKNENKSIVRETVDNWYRDHMTAYTDDLEDAVWCNDRSLYDIGGWDKNNDVFEITNEQDGKMIFNANYRVFTSGKPDINCANKNDAFTVSEENGNGNLEYPVGLMTLDEAVMAGFNWYRYDNSSDNYLNNGKGWWLMSPSLVSANNVYVGVAYSRVDHVTPIFTSNGLGGVRPMVSLKKGFRVQSGDGTSDSPFIIEK